MEKLSAEEIGKWLGVSTELAQWWIAHGVFQIDQETVRVPRDEVERHFPAGEDGERTPGVRVLEAEVAVLKETQAAIEKFYTARDASGAGLDSPECKEANRMVALIEPLLGKE